MVHLCPPALAAFLVMNNAKLESSAQISILSAFKALEERLATNTMVNRAVASPVPAMSFAAMVATPTTPTHTTPAAPPTNRPRFGNSISTALQAISFKDVASIIRSYNSTKASAPPLSQPGLRASNARTNPIPKPRMAPATFARDMTRQVCHACSKTGHWKSNCPTKRTAVPDGPETTSDKHSLPGDPPGPSPGTPKPFALMQPLWAFLQIQYLPQGCHLLYSTVQVSLLTMALSEPQSTVVWVNKSSQLSVEATTFLQIRYQPQ